MVGDERDDLHLRTSRRAHQLVQLVDTLDEPGLTPVIIITPTPTPTMTPTPTPEPESIFRDDFESGDTSAWSTTVGEVP
jgi:hypothetical protein